MSTWADDATFDTALDMLVQVAIEIGPQFVAWAPPESDGYHVIGYSNADVFHAVEAITARRYMAQVDSSLRSWKLGFVAASGVAEAWDVPDEVEVTLPPNAGKADFAAAGIEPVMTITICAARPGLTKCRPLVADGAGSWKPLEVEHGAKHRVDPDLQGLFDRLFVRS